MRNLIPLTRILSLLALLAPVAVTPGAAQASAQKAEVLIPLVPIAGGGKPRFVAVSIGGGPATLVSIDTGSVGLYVFQRQIGNDVGRTGEAIHQAYGDGTNFEGFIGEAKVRFINAVQAGSNIPDRLMTQTIKIAVITSVYCSNTRPRCPGSDLKPGIMGVGMDTGGRLASPLAQLPGTDGAGFIIDERQSDAAHILVGPDENTLRSFRFAALANGRPTTVGLPSWNSGSVRGTYVVNGCEVMEQTLLFDTGASEWVFQTQSIRDMALGPHGHLLPQQNFALHIPNVLSLSFATDRSMLIRPALVHQPGGNPSEGALAHSNTGALIYRYVAIAFDAEHGRIGFAQ